MNMVLAFAFLTFLMACNFLQGKGGSIREITLAEIDQNLTRNHYPTGRFVITDTLKIGVRETHWCPPYGGFYFGSSDQKYVLLRTMSEKPNGFSDTGFFKSQFYGKSVSAIIQFNPNQPVCEAYNCLCHSFINVEVLELQKR